MDITSICTASSVAHLSEEGVCMGDDFDTPSVLAQLI